MKKDVEVIVIDKKEYAILKELEINSTTYLYLSNLVDKDDIMIRKLDKFDNDTIIPLDSDKEFDLACSLFFKNVELQ